MTRESEHLPSFVERSDAQRHLPNYSYSTNIGREHRTRTRSAFFIIFRGVTEVCLVNCRLHLSVASRGWEDSRCILALVSLSHATRAPRPRHVPQIFASQQLIAQPPTGTKLSTCSLSPLRFDCPDIASNTKMRHWRMAAKGLRSQSSPRYTAGIRACRTDE